jgi:hypothetical protein
MGSSRTAIWMPGCRRVGNPLKKSFMRKPKKKQSRKKDCIRKAGKQENY